MKASILVIAIASIFNVGHCESDLESAFMNPPVAARPYVWWHWMGSNFSKEGITKDLEAMKAAGIGGATIFNITSAVREAEAPLPNNPWPEQTFRSPAYWEALRHAAAEAQRLGLEIGLHNTPGYSATGGPWIDEERSMQRILTSTATAEGGKRISIKIEKPAIPPHERYGVKYHKPLSFYQGIAVIAVPDDGVIRTTDVLDITRCMKPDGTLEWDAPPGKWIIHRIGHGPTGTAPAPVPDELIGHVLEADKMSPQQTQYHWEQVLEPLKQHLGPYLGKSFRHILIDSYEAGNQTWTLDFRKEFSKIKGYDPLPWIIARVPAGNDPDGKPVFRTIGSTDETARFNYDYKEVVAELFRIHGWESGAKMIRDAGLTLQFEAYGGPFDTVAGSALADLPMGEFWSTSNGLINSNIIAAGRAAGRRVIGAEAFTSKPHLSQWNETPAGLKFSADGFYSYGGNRLILHHWVHQPFDERYKPGLGMGWWGTHFNRHQTWIESGRAFFLYLARTQALLQRGEQTIEVLSVGNPTAGGDVIPKHVFLGSLKVKNRQVVTPAGRSYPLLVVPHDGRLEPESVRRIGSLLDAGAVIVAKRPDRAPGLAGYPNCDDEVRQLAAAIWDADPASRKGRLFGDGNVDGAIAALGIQPLWTFVKGETQGVRVCQRRDEETGAEIFFVANTGQKPSKFSLSCRLAGKQPELWNAEDGTIRKAPNWRSIDSRTEVDLDMGPRDACFVVFQKPSTESLGSAPPAPMATPRPVEGPWEVSFLQDGEKPLPTTFPTLASWSVHQDPRIRYFSGTATYRKKLHIDPEWLANGKRIRLDLGDVWDLAAVRLNGGTPMILWRAPYLIDLTNHTQPGDNLLEIAVTNTWKNRLIGDEQEPADMEWGEVRSLGGQKAGRGLAEWPEWFLKDLPRPANNRKTFVAWNYFTKDSALAPAGLLGSVRLLTE